MSSRSVYVLIGVTLIATVNPASAQQSRNYFQIEMQGATTFSRNYSIDLLELNGHMVVASAEPSSLGQFSFQGVPEGQYIARFVDANGRILREEPISFNGGSPIVRLNPPMEISSPRPTGAKISMRELRNPPSKQAVRNFKEAAKFAKAGQHDKAAAALEKAVELSPDFANAHTNLGAEYLRMGQFEKALDQAQSAIEIGGPNIHDLVNCALAEWKLERLPEALRYAQQALDLDHSFAPAHYVVGSLMAMKPATRQEAVRHLEIAAETLPTAAQNLAKVRMLMAGAK